MNHRYVLRSHIFVTGLVGILLTASGTSTNAQSSPPPAGESGPQPIKIERKGGKPTVPEVDHDKVICFALYTVENGILKLSAQLYPLKDDEEKSVNLEIMLAGENGGQWKSIATAPVDKAGLATFRIAEWDHSVDHSYRVTHAGGSTFAGRIRRDPADKSEIVVAAFTGNSNSDRGPRADIVENVTAQDPDLLFFSGDQSYDHSNHTAAWLLFGRQFGEIIKDRPTICIPDDHDVGQGNLWGEGGKRSLLRGGADGGYTKSPEYVRMVERAQTSHLPDAYDPAKIGSGIGVYYTSLNIGGVDFAIIEDRKFKTGPAGLVPQRGPRPDHINEPFDVDSVDVPEARLLGDRQLKFLEDWGSDWQDADMKAVLSQTIFAGGAHIHGKHNSRLLADLDSNGWPQSGRARALESIRKCFAVHIAGDQHLATVIHHGIHDWEDAGYSFCVPSIVNYYGRWWRPLEPPQEHDERDPLPFTGRFRDGLGNKVTMKAYANPGKENYNAAGYGIIRFNKPDRTVTFECWPRHGDVTAGDAKQFPGWPVTIQQSDNFSRKPLATLPLLQFQNESDPVVQIIDEYLDAVVYTLRVKGNSFRPKVFREAKYTIRVIGKDSEKKMEHVDSILLNDTSTKENPKPLEDRVMKITL